MSQIFVENKSDYKVELEKNGVISFVPGGNSMWPTLKHKKQSVIIESKKQKLKKYDVAFYKRDNGTFVLHRVLYSTPEGYVIIGDSQFNTENVREEQVFGVMVGFYQGEKYVEVTDEKYQKQVEKWFRKKRTRKIKLRIFHFIQRIKNKLKSNSIKEKDYD